MANQILELKVSDKVVWTFSDCDSEGKIGERTNSDSEPITPDPLFESTLNLLVDLQRLLSNALRMLRLKNPKGLLSDDSVKTDEALYTLAKTIGQHLYRYLFPGKLDNLLRDKLDPSKRQPDDILRIQLEFVGQSRDKLSRWPWEYLFVPDRNKPDNGEFLAIKAMLVLHRQLSFAIESGWTITIRKPKVLLVAAGLNDDYDPVPSKQIEDKLDELQQKDLIIVKKLIQPPFNNLPQEGVASFENFEDTVKKLRPNIIHFIGHGQKILKKGQLAFVGVQSAPDWRDDTEFARVAEMCGANLKLVFLQACESALPDPHAPFSSVAEELVSKNVPAIIAMQAKIQNVLATDFALKFYDGLANGLPIDLAVREAREAIRTQMKEENIAFGVPVLYLRSYKQLIELPSPSKSDADISSQKSQAPMLGVPPSSSETEAKVRCLQCGRESRATNNFCIYCHAQMRCLKCQTPLEPGASCCGTCGTPCGSTPNADSASAQPAISDVVPQASNLNANLIRVRSQSA